MKYTEVERANTEDSLVLAIINQKGGVGKTTTAINLSAVLGDCGKKTLLIDCDPQGNSTSGFGIDKAHVEQCIYDVMLGGVPVTDIIKETTVLSTFIAPATIQLTGAELDLVSVPNREKVLKHAIEPIRNDFDYILIDCPPSLGLLTINALTAADKLLIPIQCEYYALEGLSKLLDTMSLVKKRMNPDLEIFGVVMTMYDKRTSLSKQVVSEVENYFGETVFKTKIPRTVKLSEAPGYGVPITQYNSFGKGAQAYRNLAKEVINRG